MTDLPPGVHVLPEADYFAMTGHASSSVLRGLARRTPAEVRYDLDHPKTKHEYDWGTAVHTELLGTGAPVAALDFDSWRTNASKAEAEAAREEGLTPLLQHQYDAVMAAVAAVRAHPLAGPLLSAPGHSERVWLWEWDGIKCRAMIDRDTMLGRTRAFVDLKTTGKSAAVEPWAKSVTDLGYDQQADHYLSGAAALGVVDVAWLWVVVHADPPHLVAVHGLSDAFAERGHRRNAAALEVWRRCLETGEWPGHPADITYPEPPRWAA